MKSFFENLFSITVSFILSLLLFLSNVTIAQTDCDNMGFDSGDLSQWVSGRGCNENGLDWTMQGEDFGVCHDRNSPDFRKCCTGAARPMTDASLFDWEARHTMMSMGQDPYCGFPLIAPQLKGYPASKFSLRLGNARPWGQADQVERTFTVDETNAIFAYQFAFVLNDPADNGHTDRQLPFFEAGIYEANGDKVPCSYLRVLANNNKFDSVTLDSVIEPNTGLPMVVRYKNWNPIFINLTDRIGEELTIRFTNADCAKSGHWGYSYITAYCGEYVPMRDTIICANEPVTLTSPFPIEAFELEWSTGEKTEQITVTADKTTTITLRVKNRTTFEGLDEDCEDVYEVTITVGAPEVDIEDVEICAGQTATLTALPKGEVYEWYTTLTGGVPIYKGTDPYTTPPLSQDTKYYVINVSADCPPTTRTEANVAVIPSPIPAFKPNPPTAKIDNPVFVFEDESQLGVTGTWDFGDGTTQNYEVGINPTHSYYATNDAEAPFKYDITLCLQNKLGCEECVTHPIEIMNTWSLYVPNSFTPNGDGINEFFKAYGIGILEFDMRVFNRWGEVVFRSDDINKGWDGTPISGNSKKQDVYVWKVKAKNNRGEILKYMGHVSLLQ